VPSTFRMLCRLTRRAGVVGGPRCRLRCFACLFTKEFRSFVGQVGAFVGTVKRNGNECRRSLATLRALSGASPHQLLPIVSSLT
jgi:hypothetical protein